MKSINPHYEENMKIVITYLMMIYKVDYYEISTKYTKIRINGKTKKLLNKDWYDKPFEEIEKEVTK